MKELKKNTYKNNQSRIELMALAQINGHARDQYISFTAHGHKYSISFEPDVQYTSVTTWVKNQFAKFDADKIIKNMMNGRNWNEQNKYWGMTPEEIKALWNSNSAKVSGDGTNMHEQIEMFYNNHIHGTHARILSALKSKNPYEKYECVELNYFWNFVMDTPKLLPFRSEWLIYDEDLKISGSIDMIYYNVDTNDYSIYDWKRSKEIAHPESLSYGKFSINEQISHVPDTNYWHYSLQLNIYKFILERKYGLKIRDMTLVKLHPNNASENYELIPVVDMQEDVRNAFLCK